MPDTARPVSLTETRTLTVPVRAGMLRAKDKAGTGPAEFAGIAVPWDTEIDLWGVRESFAPDSIVTDDDAGVLVYYRHREPVGRAEDHGNADAGYEIRRGRLVDTTLGRDASILLREGIIDRLSVGFRPEAWEESIDKDGVVHIRHTRALLTEVSLVPNPAYQDAAITGVRHAQPKEGPAMPAPATPDADRQEMTEIRAAVEDLSRRVDLIPEALRADTTPACPLLQWRSLPDFLAAIAGGDEAATRAYTGIVSGDVVLADDEASWVGDFIRIVNAKQRVATAFQHTKDLPSKGMWLEYGLLASDTTNVAEQVAEGDPLVYGKISLTDDKTRVRTIGGWTDFSRQAIERASRNVVDLAYRAMAQKYGRAIETIARETLDAVYAARLALGGTAIVPTGVAPSALDAGDVLAMLLDLAERFDATDRNLDGMLVSRDVFRALAAIPEEKKLLQISQAPADKAGTLSISSIEANLAGLRVAVRPGWVGNKAVAFDKLAIHTQESPGAPFRLQDDDIVHLTKAFSMYGYVASFCEMPDGIVPVTFA